MDSHLKHALKFETKSPLSVQFNLCSYASKPLMIPHYLSIKISIKQKQLLNEFN